MVSPNNRHKNPAWSNQTIIDTLLTATPMFDEDDLHGTQQSIVEEAAHARQPVIRFGDLPNRPPPPMAQAHSIDDNRSLTPVSQDTYRASSPGLLSPEITDYHSFRSFHYGQSIAESFSVSELSEEAERSPEPGSPPNGQSGRNNLSRPPTPYPHGIGENDVGYAVNQEAEPSNPHPGTTPAQGASVLDPSCPCCPRCHAHHHQHHDTAWKALYAYHLTTRLVPGVLALCVCGLGFALFHNHFAALLVLAQAGAASGRRGTADFAWCVAGLVILFAGVFLLAVHLKQQPLGLPAPAPAAGAAQGGSSAPYPWAVAAPSSFVARPRGGGGGGGGLRLVIGNPSGRVRGSTNHAAEPKEIELGEMAGRSA